MISLEGDTSGQTERASPSEEPHGRGHLRKQEHPREKESVGRAWASSEGKRWGRPSHRPGNFRLMSGEGYSHYFGEREGTSRNWAITQFGSLCFGLRSVMVLVGVSFRAALQ